MQSGNLTGFTQDGERIWRHRGRMCTEEDGLRNRILEKAHKIEFTMHPRINKMYQDLKRMFWWPGMKSDVANFVNKYLVYQKVKIEHQKSSGTLQPLEIPKWKWESILMDFVIGLPRTFAGYDIIWVIVDRLTKFAHFLPIQENYPLEKIAQLYIQEIVKWQTIPSTIILDRDPRFTSQFWGAFQKAFGTRLCLSTTYHPQTGW